MSQATRILAALGTIVALALAGCTTNDDGGGEPVDNQTEDVPEDLAEFYDQSISWEACENNTEFECGTVDVPMDYDNPEAATIQVHLTRAQETAEQQPVLFNPGDRKSTRLHSSHVAISYAGA